MKVKDLILYQVATDRNYKVGDKFVFGESDNGQSYNIYNTFYQINEQPMHRVGFEKINKGEKIAPAFIVDFLVALEKYDFAFRELALEEVRKEKFPHLPSRMKCMFLTESKEECLNNLPNFANKGYGEIYQAVAVKLNGRVFYSKDVLIGREGLSLNKYKELAEKYWSQDQNSATKAREVLFEGEAEIVEILDEIKLNKKGGNYEG